MARSLRALKDREQLVAELDGPLRAHARETRRRHGSRTFMLDAAYLVPRARAGRFTDAVADFQARRPEVTVVCTGPWAPYSFAEAREADA